MIGTLASRCSRASQTEGAFALQPGILGTGVPLRQRTASIGETLISVNAWTVLLQDAVGVFDSSRMRRLTVTDQEDTQRQRQTRDKRIIFTLMAGRWIHSGSTLCTRRSFLLRQNTRRAWQQRRTFGRRPSSCLRQVLSEYILCQCCRLQVQLKALHWTHKPEGKDSQCYTTARDRYQYDLLIPLSDPVL